MILRVNIGTMSEPKWVAIDAQNASTLEGVSLSTIVSAITEVNDKKVDKVNGKALSTNDFTTAEKEKLAAIAAGATKNTVTDSVTSTSATNAASAASVKKAYDAAVAAQSAATAAQSTADSKASVSVATSDAAGLLSATDKAKLDGIAASANNYSLPDATATVKGGVTVGTNLTVSSGKLSVPAATTSTVGAVKLSDSTTTASSTVAATSTAVKAAYDAAVQAKSAAEAAQATANATAGTAATTSVDGLMTAADKAKLDGIASGANKTTVTNSVTSTSTANAASAAAVKQAYDKAVSVETSVSTMLSGAPEAFDTLKEIGDAITAGDTAHTALVSTVSNKVDKVSGKGLSTNDYTTTEKNKLAGIATGANNYVAPTATATTAGDVIVGDNIAVASGKISVANATTSAKGVVQLSSSTTSTSTSLAATASAVKTVNDSLTSHVSSDSLHITIVSGKTTSELPNSYPSGESRMFVSPDSVGYSDWMASIGLSGASHYLMIETVKTTSTNGVQRLTAYTISSSTATPKSFIRSANNSGFGPFVESLVDFSSLTTATTLANGLMSSTDKTKLDGVASGANNYSLPNATASVLGGVKVGTNLTVSSGTVSVSNASTSAKGVVQLSSSTSSTSTTLAATASAVKAAYDLASFDVLDGGTF